MELNMLMKQCFLLINQHVMLIMLIRIGVPRIHTFLHLIRHPFWYNLVEDSNQVQVSILDTPTLDKKFFHEMHFDGQALQCSCPKRKQIWGLTNISCS
jgi:hypothetical protein